MIQVTLQCDLCKSESKTYTVSSENEVYRRFKGSGYVWQEKPDGTKVLVGPSCQEGYKQAKVEAELAEKKVIEDWFKAHETSKNN